MQHFVQQRSGKAPPLVSQHRLWLQHDGIFARARKCPARLRGHLPKQLRGRRKDDPRCRRFVWRKSFLRVVPCPLNRLFPSRLRIGGRKTGRSQCYRAKECLVPAFIVRRNTYCRAWKVEGQNSLGADPLRGHLGSSRLAEPDPVSMATAVENQGSVAQPEIVGVAAQAVPT
jgi:hypothetical protein